VGEGVDADVVEHGALEQERWAHGGEDLRDVVCADLAVEGAVVLVALHERGEAVPHLAVVARREVAAGYHRTVPAELTGGVTDASRAWLATATPQGVRTP
jgi:hypothetical protein